jgi:DDE superfamily endonuclease
MAEDEGRFGRVSIPRRAWAPPGVRPQAPHQLVREYTHVYAAVAPAEGKMTSLILPSADTEMMSLFLEHVSKTYEKYFVVMQVDRASWHHSKDLKIPANIRLIAQPAYSPELNPVKSGSGMPRCAGSLGFHVVSMLTTWNPRLPASSCFLTCTL